MKQYKLAVMAGDGIGAEVIPAGMQVLRTVADEFIVVHKGRATPFDGDLDEYRTLLAERARPTIKQDAGTRRDERRERGDEAELEGELRDPLPERTRLLLRGAERRPREVTDPRPRPDGSEGRVGGLSLGESHRNLEAHATRSDGAHAARRVLRSETRTVFRRQR